VTPSDSVLPYDETIVSHLVALVQWGSASVVRLATMEIAMRLLGEITVTGGLKSEALAPMHMDVLKVSRPLWHQMQSKAIIVCLLDIVFRTDWLYSSLIYGICYKKKTIFLPTFLITSPKVQVNSL
jgi:hypothetical protein